MLEFFQQFLINFWNIMLWFAVNAIIVLVASELLRSIAGKRFRIAKDRLNEVAILLGLGFMVIVAWYGYLTWMSLQP